MKKVALCLIAVFVVFSMVACSTPKLPEGFSEEAVVNKSKEIVGLINEKNYEAVHQMVRDDVKEGLSVEALRSCETILDKSGAFEEYTNATTVGKDEKNGESYAGVVLDCKYQNSKHTYTISFDKNMEIIGLFVK